MKFLLTKEHYFELRKNPGEFQRFLEQFAHLPRKSREEELAELEELDRFLEEERLINSNKQNAEET
ncbi:MAG: hypothetical protein ACRCXZ_02460 [Patescibacteria group bacterium]